MEAIDAAWQVDIRLFDTAPHYGLGLSERRLGQALAHRPRREYVLSTKVGRVLEPNGGPPGRDPEGFDVPNDLVRRWDFTRDGVRRSLESSLTRLGLDRVDIGLVHDPDVSGIPGALSSGLDALSELRGEGVVTAVGVGTNDLQTAVAALAHDTCDLVMLAGRYTLLEQLNASHLFAAAAQKGLLMVGVFNSGLLAQDDVPDDAHYDYAQAPPDLVRRARALSAACRANGASLPQAAIAFPLRQPSVSSVVLGARTADQIRHNVGRYRTPLPDGFWGRIEAEAGLGLQPDAAP